MTPSRSDDGLSSSAVPPVGEDDHVLGAGGRLVIEYADLECPYCAKANLLLTGLPVRRVFRHFPIVSKHPRARVLAQALEAAGMQGRFWEMHGSLLADQGHLDDPHLWERCEQLGLDVARFDADRRSDAVADAVRRRRSAPGRPGCGSDFPAQRMTPTVRTQSRALAAEQAAATLPGTPIEKS